MPKLTRQEYYDLLVKTSREGGFPALGDYKRCLYRAPDGRRCVAGLLIPDEDYSPDLEGRTAHNLPRWLREKILPEGMLLEELTSIQAYHDRWTNGGWDHEGFLLRLNTFDCFQDVTQVSE